MSVLIPTYNRPREVRRAVESALKNDSVDEVIVGDDGSDVPLRIDIPKVKVLKFEHTGNPSFVRNRLIEEAKSPLLAFLDDDDEFVEGKLDKQVRNLIDNDEIANFSNVVVIDSRTGKNLGLAYTPSRKPLLNRIMFPFEKDGLILQVGALLVRKEALIEVGGFDERLTLLEDWELSLRLALKGYLSLCDFPGLIHYQNRRDSLRMKQSTEVIRKYETLLDVVSEYLPEDTLRKVKSHFYGFLAYRLGRMGFRKEAMRYAFKSMSFGWNALAVKGLARAFMI